jgi:hypothetical protein
MALRTPTDQESADKFGGLHSMPRGGTILASFNGAAADPPPIEFTPMSVDNLKVICNVSVISGAGATLVVNIDVWDKASGLWFLVLAGTGQTAVTTPLTPQAGSVLHVSPNMTAVAGQVANACCGETMRIRPVKSGTTTTLVYSIGAITT